MWTKKKKIWRKSIYLYFCTEETHGTKTLLVLCLHANKMSGIVWPSFPAPCRRHPPEMMTERRTGVFFFYIKRCFVLFTPHSTRLGSTESIWKNLYNRHQIYAVYQVSDFPSFFFFGLNFILFALSNLLLGSQLSIVNRLIFCVVIYVLYTNIVHKMSLQREKEIEERL